jgi:uncharacterized membrane protein YhaH (DUF805 family)
MIIPAVLNVFGDMASIALMRSAVASTEHWDTRKTPWKLTYAVIAILIIFYVVTCVSVVVFTSYNAGNIVAHKYEPQFYWDVFWQVVPVALRTEAHLVLTRPLGDVGASGIGLLSIQVIIPLTTFVLLILFAYLLFMGRNILRDRVMKFLERFDEFPKGVFASIAAVITGIAAILTALSRWLG